MARYLLGVVVGVLVAIRCMAESDEAILMQSVGRVRRKYTSPAGRRVARNNATGTEHLSSYSAGEAEEYEKWMDDFTTPKSYVASLDIPETVPFGVDMVGDHRTDIARGSRPELFAWKRYFDTLHEKYDYWHPDGVARNPNQDMDGDLRMNEQDGDMDGDHIMNDDDAFPRNILETEDWDGDGIGNNEEASPYGDLDNDGLVNKFDQDIDGDSVLNRMDQLPRDPSEFLDMDGDNVGDREDAFPDDQNYVGDLNGDGFPDYEQKDADLDGVPNSVEIYHGTYHTK